MNISEFAKPVTAKKLNESLAKRFGKRIALESFTLAQLHNARNKLRTRLSQIEMNESFSSVVESDEYQKSKLFLDVLNAEISERADISEGEMPAGLKKHMEKKNKKDKMKVLNCAECNKSFVSNKRKKYCSDECLKQKKLAYWREFYQKNKEYKKNWVENNHMKVTINKWKLRGLNSDDYESDDYESIYYLVMSTENCEGCGCKLTDNKPRTSTSRCMDHDHETGLFRAVLCLVCNSKQPRQPRQKVATNLKNSIFKNKVI